MNSDKTKIMHVRPKNVIRTKYEFTYGEDILEKVDNYKYLGCNINEYGISLDNGDVRVSRLIHRSPSRPSHLTGQL